MMSSNATGGFMPRPPPPAIDQGGFKVGRGPARQPDLMMPPGPDPELTRQIAAATMSQSILQLWSSKQPLWVESHLSSGLLRVSQLAEEEGEYARQQVRLSPEVKQMMGTAQRVMETMQPADRSKISRAMGRLEWSDAAFCQKLWQTTSSTLSSYKPIALAGIMVGLSQVGYKYDPSFVFLDAGPLKAVVPMSLI